MNDNELKMIFSGMFEDIPNNCINKVLNSEIYNITSNGFTLTIILKGGVIGVRKKNI